MQLDDLLRLLEYQDSRRNLLTLISTLHNRSHAEHRYRSISDEPGGPVALEPSPKPDEKDRGSAIRAPEYESEVPRLAFWRDVEQRLAEINSATRHTKVTTPREKDRKHKRIISL